MIAVKCDQQISFRNLFLYENIRLSDFAYMQ